MINSHKMTRWVAGLCLLLASTSSAQNIAQLTSTVQTQDVYVRGSAQVAVTVAGTFTGTITFKAKHPNSDPVAIDCFQPSTPTTAVNSVTAPGSWTCAVAGYTYFEVQYSAYTSGTATVTVDTASAAGIYPGSSGGGGGGTGDASEAEQQAQTAILTTIDADTGAVALGIGGTADAAATQGSTGSVSAKLRTVTSQLNTIATTGIPVTGTVTVDGSGVTQPVSGTVTADLGATDNAVLDAIAASLAGTLVVGDGGGALTVDGSISCSNCSGSGASAVDDAAFTVATDSTAPAGFLFDDVTPDSVNEGDSGIGRMSANRNQYVTLRDAAGNERGVNVTAGNALTVDGSATTQPVSGTVTANAGTGPWPITDNSGSITVDNAGTFSVQCTSGCSGGTTDTDDGSIAGSQTTGLSISLLHGWNGSAWVRATTPTDATADDPALTTGPVVMGYGSSTTPTAMSANGDATRIWTSLNGSVNTILRGTDGTSAFGTAGTAATPVLSVQGIASGTALGVSDNSGSLTVDAPVTTPVFVRLSDGSSAIATLPVSLASVPSHAVTNAGTFAVQPAGSVAHDTAATSVNPVLVGGYASTTVPTAVSTATDSVRAWLTLNGAQVVVNSDPCGGRGTKVNVAISQATSTQLFAGTASNRTFICSLSIMQRASSTQTWSLVSGTGTTCATGTGALIGATTAADGTDLSMTQGSGTGTILKTATDADNVCLLQSGTDRLNGYITYVVSPNQ